MNKLTRNGTFLRGGTMDRSTRFSLRRIILLVVCLVLLCYDLTTMAADSETVEGQVPLPVVLTALADFKPQSDADLELAVQWKTEVLQRLAVDAVNGDQATALALAASTLKDAERVYGKQDVRLVPVLRAAAKVYLRFQAPRRAVDLLNQAYAISRLALGNSDPANRFVLTELALAQRDAGDAKKAETSSAQAAELDAIASASLSGFRPLSAGPTPDPAAAYQIVPVFYQTTRAPTGKRDPLAYFGTTRAAGSHYGVSYVSVPRTRDVGSIPHPSVFRLDFSSDPARHVIVKEVTELGSVEKFWTSLRKGIEWSDHKETLVYIHGFNQSFQDSVETAATLAVDLEIDGNVIAFSWPSKKSLLGYPADLDEATSSVNREALLELLTNVAGQTASKHVYVIAHSMGSRLLLESLTLIAASGRKLPVDSVVFAAPDVESADFTSTVARLDTLAIHMTLYAAGGDRALQLSQTIHSASPGQRELLRAGELEGGVLPTKLLDVIDVSKAKHDAVGHSDFVYMAKDDLRALIWFGLPAEARCVLTGERTKGWRYAPAVPCSSDAFALASLYYRRYGDSGQALSHLGRATDGVARMAVPILKNFAAKQK
ncbi:alpha/beta hydrolase [Duganella vulcania]|uniref:Alpha/beta hydrolase n=1 Tax=Duganella vulcania TaxID=2692166 RepID=A0A845GJF5_9BURK|nr:alpha/beta hydrolase [Duganella vulcania]MYM92789.1 alpha/beta hydrolase [Duganella vulcania]